MAAYERISPGSPTVARADHNSRGVTPFVITADNRSSQQSGRGMRHVSGEQCVGGGAWLSMYVSRTTPALHPQPRIIGTAAPRGNSNWAA